MNYMSVHALVAIGPVQTVTFDVGGRIHKVSDLLLRRQPHCTLGQLRNRTADNNEPIFIDRDGDLFVYVLNYLREGEIVLPTSVPRTTFLKELKYYHIDVIPGSVQQFITPVVCLDVCITALIGWAGLCTLWLGSSMRR